MAGLPLKSTSKLGLPSRFGSDRYEVRGILGTGSVCIVLQVWDRVLAIDRAAKVLRAERRTEPWAVKRLHNEGRALAKVDHPHIVQAFDIFTDPTVGVALILELLPSASWHLQLSRPGRPAPEHIRRIGIELAEGLAHLHDRGFVHRDVRPANVLFSPSGTAKLIDFGLALAADSIASHRVTAVGRSLGDRNFVAPEQAVDATQVEGSADVFALGMSLYWASTGTLPSDRLAAIASTRHADWWAVPRVLRTAVVRACQLEPDARPTAAELAELLGS